MTNWVVIDEPLLRRLIADEEREHLEFKAGLLSRKEIGEYAVGVGNEGGGWLVMGVTDKQPRRIKGIKELDGVEIQKIRDGVLDATGIQVEVAPIDTSEGFVLAVKIPSRPKGRVFFTKTGKYLMRTGEGLRGMPPDEIERIRSEELARPDFTADPVDGTWRTLLDPVEIERLKQILAKNKRDDLARLGTEELLRSLELFTRKEGRVRVTRAAVLVVGKRDAVRQLIPHHEAKLQRYGANDLVIDFNEDTRGALLAVLQRAFEVVEVANSVESFQSGLFRVDVHKFPPLAYREAIVNALTHRDYQQSGNVSLRVYRNRIEVGSPGGWFGGVNERNILVTESRRRNELLASVLQRIGLAERSALGVKRMFRSMLEAGKPAPEYRSIGESVTVTLRDGSFDKAFARLASHCSRDGHDLGVFDLLILSHLRKHREIKVKEAAELCQQSPADVRQLLADLRARHLVDRQGEGAGRKYLLGALAYEQLGLEDERPRDVTMAEKTFEGLLKDELERRKEKGLTSSEIREWSRYGKAQTTRLLRRLCDRGVIISSGKRGRGARYWLMDYAPRQ